MVQQALEWVASMTVYSVAALLSEIVNNHIPHLFAVVKDFATGVAELEYEDMAYSLLELVEEMYDLLKTLYIEALHLSRTFYSVAILILPRNFVVTVMLSLFLAFLLGFYKLIKTLFTILECILYVIFFQPLRVVQFVLRGLGW